MVADVSQVLTAKPNLRVGTVTARGYELLFFVIALAFVLWLGNAVQSQAGDGVSRWKRDIQVSKVQPDILMDSNLTIRWCGRDADFVQGLDYSNLHWKCRATWKNIVDSWVGTRKPELDWTSQQRHALIAIWQKELLTRANQWRSALAELDSAQLESAIATKEIEDAEAGANDSSEGATTSVLQERQLSDDVRRLQIRINERMGQWDSWVEAFVVPATLLEPSVVNPEELFRLATSIEGIGQDAGARLVRQYTKANENSARAERLLNIQDRLLWLLGAHWLFTVIAATWIRNGAAPLQQLTGLALLGFAFWGLIALLGAAPTPTAITPLVLLLGILVVGSWVSHHFFASKLQIRSPGGVLFSTWLPGWWLFTSVGWLLIFDQSLHFHDRLRFLALDQWWAWCISAFILPMAAWAAPAITSWIKVLNFFLWGVRPLLWKLVGLIFGLLVVAVFFLAHRQGLPQHVTGEFLKLIFVICLSGWCIWKMPVAAQLWHAGHARAALPYLLGCVLLLVLSAVAAFLTADRGPLLVMCLLMAVLLSSVMGWTGGMGMLLIGFLLIFLIGVDLDVVGERLQAWRDPFTANHDDMARLIWFQVESARTSWGFGAGYVPWCGTSRLDVCRGLPLQLQSDYTFTALMGWWGPWGSWLWLLLFNTYIYRALVHCVRISPATMTPLALLQTDAFRRALSVHLLFLWAALMLMQTWITVAGNVGWLPLTGLTWPLMSYGKTSLWVSTMFVGAWGLRGEHV